MSLHLPEEDSEGEGRDRLCFIGDCIIFLHLLRSRTFFAHVCDRTLHAQQVQCDVSLSLFK